MALWHTVKYIRNTLYTGGLQITISVSFNITEHTHTVQYSTYLKIPPVSHTYLSVSEVLYRYSDGIHCNVLDLKWNICSRILGTIYILMELLGELF